MTSSTSLIPLTPPSTLSSLPSCIYYPPCAIFESSIYNQTSRHSKIEASNREYMGMIEKTHFNIPDINRRNTRRNTSNRDRERDGIKIEDRLLKLGYISKLKKDEIMKEELTIKNDELLKQCTFYPKISDNSNDITLNSMNSRREPIESYSIKWKAHRDLKLKEELENKKNKERYSYKPEINENSIKITQNSKKHQLRSVDLLYYFKDRQRASFLHLDSVREEYFKTITKDVPDINPVSKEIINQKVPFAPDIGISKNVDALLLLRAKCGIQRCSSETKLKLSRTKTSQSTGSGVLMTSPLHRNNTFANFNTSPKSKNNQVISSLNRNKTLSNIDTFQGTSTSNHKLKESYGPNMTISQKLQNIIFDVEAELEKLHRSEITEDEFQEEMYEQYVSHKKDIEELRSQPVTIDLFD